MEVVVPAPKESRQKLSDMMMAAEGMAVNPMAIPKVSVTIAKNEAIPKMWPVWSSIRQWASHGERCEGHSDHKEQEEEPAAEHLKRKYPEVIFEMVDLPYFLLLLSLLL